MSGAEKKLHRSCGARADNVHLGISISLRDISTEIILRLYRPLHSGKIVVRRSHDLSISQAAAHPPSAAADGRDSEGDALHAAVDEVVRMYITRLARKA